MLISPAFGRHGSTSWLHAASVVSTIRMEEGWNGTGFQAKELAVDLMLTPVFLIAEDFNFLLATGLEQ